MTRGISLIIKNKQNGITLLQYLKQDAEATILVDSWVVESESRSRNHGVVFLVMIESEPELFF